MSKIKVKKYIQSLERKQQEKLVIPTIRECARAIAKVYDMWDKYYEATIKSFREAMKFIRCNDLQSKFQRRLGDILENCEGPSRWYTGMMFETYVDNADMEIDDLIETVEEHD